jgi:cell wall-associated protease
VGIIFFLLLLMKKTPFSLLCLLVLPFISTAQKKPVHGWHTKDFDSDGFYGISLEKAYSFLKEKKLKPVTVTVGILDSGTDTTHEDLAPVLWSNKKEIAGNKKDDDGNGYADDVHGWNFLGNEAGQNVTANSSEWIRVYWRYKNLYEGKTIDGSKLSQKEKYDYALWQKAKSGVVGRGMRDGELDTVRQYVNTVIFCDSMFKIFTDKKNYDKKDVDQFKPKDEQQKALQQFLTDFFSQFISPTIQNDNAVTEVKKYLESEEAKASGDKVPPQNSRFEITGDDETNPGTKFYGNNNIAAGETVHGTHVAGIIGAARNNGKGIDGIASAVKLLTVRTTPDGDELDKDIAMAIRYAVNNGAKIISMSFGKSLSPDKYMIDDAVKFAMENDVLIVHGAGNSKRNINAFDNFPNPKFLFTDSIAPNWITVGASDCNGKAADFSNYGDKIVDVFAPGVAIYSTVPFGNKYMDLDGTSMATPVVSGTAAVIRSYFPKLTATQVKKIIELSVMKPSETGKMPGSEENVTMDKICRSGGVVNVYKAVVLAYEWGNKNLQRH